MPITREEILWIKKDKFSFTTLFIWSDKYIPYQCAMFRSEIKHSAIVTAVYYKIGDHVFCQNSMYNIDADTTEQEKLFHITVYAKKLLDKKINEWLNTRNQTSACDESVNENDEEILNTVFYDQETMELFKMTHPDFGFYSLSPNFHMLRNLLENGKTPNINEEFDRLNKKYHK